MVHVNYIFLDLHCFYFPSPILMAVNFNTFMHPKISLRIFSKKIRFNSQFEQSKEMILFINNNVLMTPES